LTRLSIVTRIITSSSPSAGFAFAETNEGGNKNEECRKVCGGNKMRSSNNILFHREGIFELPRCFEAEMYKEIDAIDGNKLLNTSIEDLANYFEQNYKINVPILKEDQITVDQNETKIDVSHDFNRFIPNGETAYVPGTKVTYFVPFEGDASLFQFHASTYSLNPPRAEIAGHDLEISFVFERANPDQIGEKFKKTLAEIKSNLECMRNDVKSHNESILNKAKGRIEARRQKLLNDQGIVASLGFPLKQREGTAKTYIAPVAKKRITLSMPSASTQPFKPEPTLDMKEYENILSIISNMVTVMERSPMAFKDMKEEDIRQHFLVQLNGQYEGQATGETFNYEGKTDILIRAGGKNIFIAECKFWKGPKGFTEAIDQLLGYTTWRDTKTAILVFNRNKTFSEVIAQVPDLVKQYPCYKRQLSYNSETGFRFVFHHRDDKNREIILTVLCFDVPA
jgi:hypothetical protein